MVTLFVFVSSDGVCALAVDRGGSVCMSSRMICKNQLMLYLFYLSNALLIPS